MVDGTTPWTRRRNLAVLLLALCGLLAPAVAPPPVGADDNLAATVDGTPLVGADYWIEAFSNPLDFDDPADVVIADEGPMQGFAEHFLDGGVLRFTMTGEGGAAPAPGYFSPIWGGYAAAAAQGREGATRPVDAARFTRLALRMSASAEVAAGVRWYTCPSGVADSCQGGFPFVVQPGWHTYAFDLTSPALRVSDPALQQPWAGKVTGLRLAFSPSTSASFDVDWIRLMTEPAANGNTASDGSLRGPVPQVLNPDALGAIPAVLNDDGAPIATVNPSPCGDYATLARAGDSWDFDRASDVAGVDNLVSWDVTGGWFHGRSAPSADGRLPGDPGVRLATPVAIDPSRFRHATVVIPRAEGSYSQRPGPGGVWVVRFAWKFTNRPNFWEVSRELVHYPQQKVITVDLADPHPFDGVDATPAEITDTERGGTGWNVAGKTVAVFRYDPHEDYVSRDFWADQLWLAEDDCGTDGFTILYRDRNWAPGTTADFYADTDAFGFDGTLIARDVDVTEGINAFRWTGGRAGRWWIVAVLHRAGADGRAYSTGPVRLGAAPPPLVTTTTRPTVTSKAPRGRATTTKARKATTTKRR